MQHNGKVLMAFLNPYMYNHTAYLARAKLGYTYSSNSSIVVWNGGPVNGFLSLVCYSWEV